MEFLEKNINKFIFAVSIAAAFLIYIYMFRAIPTPDIFNVRITDVYALTSLFLLYAALLIDPLYEAFPNLFLKDLFINARASLFASALFFSFLHTYNSFFNLLGGFGGLGFLAANYLVGISLSAVALLLLAAAVAASLPFLKNKIGSWAKVLYGAVYFSGLLIVFHALILGSHFVQLSRVIPQIFFFALIILVMLEALRIDKYFTQKLDLANRFSYVSIIITALVIGLYFTYLSPHQDSGGNNLGVHAQHILLAQQAQSNPVDLDRFTVSMIPQQGEIEPNKDIKLIFRVYNAATGQQVTDFDTVYTKLAHMVVVNNSLDYFNHIHPSFENGEFSITTQFPKSDLYHIYLNFQPSGSIEQQIGMTLQVGTGSSVLSAQAPDENLTKVFGKYKVTLVKQDDFRAKDMSTGLQPMVFGITDAATGVPVKNLQPYLGAFGHLTMVNEKTFNYIHVHPQTLVTGAPGEVSGPSIQFVPFGLYGPIKPGIYRVFGEFKPGGNLLTADFTVNIQ